MQSDLIFFEGEEGNEINTVIHKTSNSLKANVCLTKPMSAENISWRRCRLFDQPRPQGFSLKKWPTHLREKPWGRGCCLIS